MKYLFTFKNPAAFQASIVMFVFVLFLILVVFSINSFAQATFSTKTDFTTGSGTFSVAIRDLNGDGKPDIAAANGNSNTVSVLLNTTTTGSATPTFSAKTDFSTGPHPTSVAIGDFNGDGKPDMVVTNADSTSVSVFLNTTIPGASTPTFSARTNFSTEVGAEPHSVSISDFNGDGKLDFVVTFAADTKVSVYLNTTTPGASAPTFSVKTDFTTGSVSYSVSIEDFNGDGKPDLVSANAGANTVSVLFNTTPTGNAAPSFSAKTDFATGSYAGTVSVGDFNGDGKPDMAVTNASSNSVSVLLNTTPTGNSTPTFSAKTDFTTGTFPYAVSVYDINDDGKPDMAVANYDENSVSVFLNTTTPGASTPTFTDKTDFTTGTSPSSVSICDLNGDGKPDMASANYNENNVSVLLNTMTLGVAAPSFSAGTGIAAAGSAQDVCSADFNGDGKPDFASANYGSSTISVNLNTTTPGASTPTFSSFTTFAANTSVIGIWSADFNGDGKPDLACINYGPSIISVYINTTTPGASTPTFTAKTDFASINTGNYLVAADFNGDGKPDLACTDMNDNSMSVFLNTTTPGSTTPSFAAKTTFTAGNHVNKILASDFNCDGKPDIVVGNRDANNISVYINTTTPGAATPTFTAKTDFAVNGNAYGLGSGDFNGDGKQDIACANGSVISVFLNTTTPGATTPTFSAKTDFATTATAFYICTADFNGDGKIDLGYTNSSYCSIYLNNTAPGSSTPSFNNKTDYATGGGGIFEADFNLDGKKDLITSSGNSGSTFVYLNQANLPVPVELSSFTSSVDKQNVTLSWSTVQEENNRGFDIERNSFGAGWKKVGYTEGHGTTNQISNYSFTERGMATGHYNYRLKQIDYNGNYKYYDLTNEVIIGIPQKYSLVQNYPNPFNPVSVIGYQLPASGFVSLTVFDISGREVSILVNEVKEAGYYSVTFDAKSLSSGTYFYKLTAEGDKSKFVSTKKMILIK